MNFNPLVSVTLLCYNHERYIAKAIESVISQTYKNIELIIVDNGSTDNSKNIIKSEIKNDNRVFFIDLTENTFVSYGWNYGAKQCKGDYIVSLSGDDYFELNKIEMQLNFMQENKLSNSFTWINCVNNDERILDNHNLESIFNRRFDSSTLKRILITEGNTLCATSFMFHKSIFEKYGYFDNRLLQSQDYDLWLKILINEDIFILPEKLTNYRVRDDDGNLSINMDESSRKRSSFESVLFLKQITSFDIETISLAIEENCNEENKYIKLFNYFIKKEKKLYATAILLSMYEDLNKNSKFNLEKYKHFFNMYSEFDLLNIIENEKLREIVHKKDLQIEELNELVKSYRDISSEQLLNDKNIQKQDIEKLEGKISFLENELVNIYTSKSWQITKPFRNIIKKIRNFKKA